MFDDAESGPESLDQQDAFDMLAELERNTPEEIRRQRTNFRISIKARVILRPGNSSEVRRFKLQGVTGDLSAGGCGLLLPVPVTPGDIYRIEFDRRTLDLPLMFARCVRCQLFREDAFEAGFRFFKSIAMPETFQVAAAAKTD